MGYCCSYDEMRVIDTSVVMEVIVKVEEYGIVVFSNIIFGYSCNSLLIIMILMRKY